MRPWAPAILCVLLGCAPELPANAIFDGECTSSGVRRDATGTEPYTETGMIEIAIHGDMFAQDTCTGSIVGYDGESFNLTDVGCESVPGVVLLIGDGTGTLRDGVLTIELPVMLEITSSGVTYEYTMSCEATER